MSDDEFVEQVRHSNDIVEVVSEYVALQQRGSSMVGLCPFHQENTPSFTVSPQRQLYYCFGCQAGGDVFSFIMDIEGYDFAEALQYLAQRAGLDMPSGQTGGGHSSSRRSNKARVRRYLHKLGAFVTKFFRRNLKSESGRRARRYFRERGIPPEVQQKYRLGWAADSWNALCDHLMEHNVNMKAAQLFGVVKKSDKTSNYYDVLRGRVIFPITDPRGKVVGFGGRVIDPNEEPKYLNTPESPVFKKRETWYGLEQARPDIRQKDRAIIVEGYTDVLACCTRGWGETVASMGTSLTSEHARVLARYTDEALVAYDADAAGTDAAVRSMNQFTGTSVALKVVSLPPDEDPDDVLSTDNGEEAFERHLSEAKSFFRFCWERSQRRRDVSSSTGKAEVIRDMAPLIWAEEDDVIQADRIRFMAQSLEVEETAVRRQLSKLQNVAQKYRADQDRHNTKEKYGTELDLKAGLAGWRAERQVIRMMLHAPNFLEHGRNALSANDFEDEVHRSLAKTILRSDCSHVQQMQSEVLAGCSDESQRRTLSEILMEDTVPSDKMQQVYSDCIELLLRRRKERRIEEIRTTIRQYDRQGKKIPTKLMREQADILAELKGKQSSFTE